MKFLLLLSILFGTVFGAQALDNEAVKAFMNAEHDYIYRLPVELKICVSGIAYPQVVGALSLSRFYRYHSLTI